MRPRRTAPSRPCRGGTLIGVLMLGAMLSGLAWASAWVLWQLLATSQQADTAAARQQMLAEGAQVLELAARWDKGAEAWSGPGSPVGHRAAVALAWQTVRHQPASPVRAWWPHGLDPEALTWEESPEAARLCWPSRHGAAHRGGGRLVLARVDSRLGEGAAASGPSEELCHEWR